MPVLLLHVGAVVLVARPVPGESQLLLLALAQKLLVDELGAVVRVDAQDRKGELRGGLPDRGEHPFLRLVPHRNGLGPAGRDVSDIEGETELALAVPTSPKMPEYCRATRAGAVPSFLNPASSITHASA